MVLLKTTKLTINKRIEILPMQQITSKIIGYKVLNKDEKTPEISPPTTKDMPIGTIYVEPIFEDLGFKPIRLERGEVLHGVTIKVKPGIFEHGFYLTLNSTEINNKKVPIEIFIETKNSEAFALCKWFSLTVTAVLRTGIDISFLLDEYATIEDPVNGNFFYKKANYKSLIHLFAKEIKDYLQTLN